jgi:hypothetical protein
MNRYSLYGISFDSELRFDGLPETEDLPELTVRLQPGTAFRGSKVSGTLVDEHGHIHWYWPTVGGFEIHTDAIIDVYPDDGATQSQIGLFLLGPVLAQYSFRLGILPLHASAVQVNNGAVLIAGNSGMGKSSLSLALNQRGCPFISDDVAALRIGSDGVTVAPGPSRVKVFPFTLEQLGIDVDESDALIDGMSKRVYSCRNGVCKSLPVHAIYILNGSEATTASETLSGESGFYQLIPHVWGLRHVNVSNAIFQKCAAVFNACSVQSLVVEDVQNQLNELCDSVLGG